MAVRNINLHQISGNSINSFLSLCHQFYYNPKTHARNLKLRNMHKKVQVGKDQEKAQSEKDSHSKNRGGKKPN